MQGSSHEYVELRLRSKITRYFETNGTPGSSEYLDETTGVVCSISLFFKTVIMIIFNIGVLGQKSVPTGSIPR